MWISKLVLRGTQTKAISPSASYLKVGFFSKNLSSLYSLLNALLYCHAGMLRPTMGPLQALLANHRSGLCQVLTNHRSGGCHVMAAVGKHDCSRRRGEGTTAVQVQVQTEDTAAAAGQAAAAVGGCSAVLGSTKCQTLSNRHGRIYRKKTSW